MKFIVNGAGGAMGKVLCDIIKNSEKHQTVAFCSMEYTTDKENLIYSNIKEYEGEADCIIDFSHHSATKDVTEYAVERNISLVVATTGQTEEEKQIIEEAAKKIPLFCSANMSFGVAILSCLAKIVAKAIPDCDIEIIEKHHNRKLDAPSGTALMIADSIKGVRPNAYNNLGRSGQGKRTPDEIGIHAIRMGNIVGEHEVIIGTQNQTITLKHEAHSRALFAEGALAAAAFLIGRDAGMYDMKSLVSGEKRELD